MATAEEEDTRLRYPTECTRLQCKNAQIETANQKTFIMFRFNDLFYHLFFNFPSTKYNHSSPPANPKPTPNYYSPAAQATHSSSPPTPLHS